jgi:hypothetical protein
VLKGKVQTWIVVAKAAPGDMDVSVTVTATKEGVL